MKSKQTSKQRTGNNPYYGGDKVDWDDEGTQKLYLTDCRRRQAASYPAFVFKSPSVRMLIQTPEIGDLLVSSGQSRLHLHLQQQYTPHTKNNNSFPFSQLEESAFPPFPLSLTEEASKFRSHGLPLLVWPRTTNPKGIQQYLTDNYPDCAHWFSELTKVSAWLEQKWRPLVEMAGLNTASDAPATGSESVWLHGVPRDSVAATYARQRLADYEQYAAKLKEYLTHRRQFTPAFQFNPIHGELRELAELRAEALPDDSGFFNVVGNRLLQLARNAKLSGTAVRLNIKSIGRSVEDTAVRTQLFHSLLPATSLKKALKKKPICPTTTTVDEELLSGSQSDEVSQMDESDEEKNPSMESDFGTVGTLHYPNRPITRDIMENRGLVKYRHKRERNPRVHLRHKYKKATIRYRSRVPPVRHEETPYAGEAKGIRVHLVKSHKFKRP
ncbi:hypothetical protein CSKR_101765 [Clonorchis sinensis]|uniref:Sas10 C-terminal domain-containing protein n=1 Tax=Clonorchis sinensis TaxID=79923 RepID=A0A8T1MN48_CLOSI|nr:hypothetical protein CSKR_101765 [Clonorchis sinensis]